MKRITLLSLVMMVCLPNLFGQNVHLQSSFNRDDSGMHLILRVINSSQENVYVPLSHWWIDGVKDEHDRLLGFPDITFVVNCIYYKPLSFKRRGMPTSGDLGYFPDYTKLPLYLRINPHSTNYIDIRLPDSIGTWAKAGKYILGCVFCYCYEKQWLRMKKVFGKNIENAIILPTALKTIEVLNERQVVEVKMSTVKVDTKKSKFIRSLFKFRMGADCET